MARLRAELTRPLAMAIVRQPLLRHLLASERMGALVEGVSVDEDLAAVLGLDDLKGDSSIAGLAPRVARAKFAEGIAVIEGDPPPGVRARELTYRGAVSLLRARLYEPEGLASPSPGILYVHGGGFMTCDLDTHDVFCRRLALGANARVVSIEYRLSPEEPYPAALLDGLAAYRWLVDVAPTLGIVRTRIAVAGESAGAHLSALIAQHMRGEDVPPALQVLIYPAVDATRSMASHLLLGDRWMLTQDMLTAFYTSYFGDRMSVRREPDASPLFANSLAGVAPALVYTAGFDPLKDEGLAYAERLVREGVPARHARFARLIHGFITMTGVSKASQIACERMATEIGEALRVGVRPV